jgi:hypothetical protein
MIIWVLALMLQFARLALLVHLYQVHVEVLLVLLLIKVASRVILFRLQDWELVILTPRISSQKGVVG